MCTHRVRICLLQRESKYANIDYAKDNLDFSQIKYPTPLSDIPKFENSNDISLVVTLPSHPCGYFRTMERTSYDVLREKVHAAATTAAGGGYYRYAYRRYEQLDRAAAATLSPI